MIWIEPVTDRSQSDVEYLKSICNLILQNGFDSLSSDQKLYWFYAR